MYHESNSLLHRRILLLCFISILQSSDARPLVFALPLKSGGFTPLKLRWEWSETLEIVMQ